MTTALTDLEHHQSLLLDNVRHADAADYNRQFHPDLSPLGWHLGHCVFTEIYWIREQVLNETNQTTQLKALYVPELMPKGERAAALPDFDALCEWARRTQTENLSLLSELQVSNRRDGLLRDNYLAHFLNQHNAQHYETTMYVLAQRRKRLSNGGEEAASSPAGETPAAETVTVPAGEYQIGAEDRAGTYDNERPAFNVHLETFHIARRPVNNAEYRRFMESGGYEWPQYWPAQGWEWRRQNRITMPDHWFDRDGVCYGIDENGVHALAAEAPVHGISWYEARAFAAWAGARLPHEYEWEAARRLGVLEDSGRVWEWCANAFHPYRGFTAFPYEGYSVPYFDGRHFTLRGGSDYTRPCIRRPSFRNYYEADKRHIRAGLRLVYP